VSDGGGSPARRRVWDHPFFQGLSSPLVQEADAHATAREYAAGELLFREGEAAEAFHLIFEGKVALEIAAADRERLTIQTVGPRDVVGWSWLVPPNRWRFDARALKATQTLAVESGALLAAFDARPEDGYAFLRRLVPVIGERLEMARIQIVNIHGV
jgi:CRP/FNR family transcriptional regulator, cyclic AMP receptor protein